MSDSLRSQLLLSIGTKNPAKVYAIQETLISESLQFSSVDVPSGVSCQPFSDDETRSGAINRAKAALQALDSDLGIGLEGGVRETDNGRLYLCNWGALVDSNGQIWEACGLGIPVPVEVQNQLLMGRELGTIMDQLAKESETSKREGAVGFFTDNWISRKEMFSQIVKAVYGQYVTTKI